jgi:hypothetical protein
MNDFLVFGCVAVASFSSGKLLSIGGWATLNVLVFPLVAVAIGAMVWGMSRGVFTTRQDAPAS